MVKDNTLKVILIEDEQRIRNILKIKIENIPGCRVIGYADNGEMGIELVREMKPDVVFVDIMMPVMDGLEFSLKMKQHFPDMIVVIVSGYSDFSYAKQAMRYGVFNYMLKPIDDEELISTIEEIKRIVQLNNDVIGSHILFSNEFLNENSKSYPNSYIFSITLGNLCVNNLDTVLYEHYKKIQEPIDWGRLIEKAKIEGYQWIITDEQSKNHYNIIIKSNKKGKELELKTIADNIFDYIKSVVEQNVILNICYSSKPIDFEEIWTKIRKLRKVINDCLIIGEDKIINADHHINNKGDQLIDVVKLKLSDKSVDFNNLNDIEEFRKDTGLIFNYIVNNKPTQRVFEKILLYILRKFEFSAKSYDKNIFDNLQLELQRNISTANSYRDIEKSFSNCIDIFFGDSSKKNDSDYKAILQFLESNYTKNISLEDVSNRFNYSGSHISRLIKNETGYSFSRYITTKRIEMAKQLIRSSDNSFRSIAQLVGYENGRYFSRVFRAETGMTPSEFKYGKGK